MNESTQTSNGKAYEYACLLAFQSLVSPHRRVVILASDSLSTAKEYFTALDEQSQGTMRMSALAGSRTVLKAEPKIIEDGGDDLELAIQPDKRGEEGDVRDVLIIRRSILWEIGISVKHNHFAVKHSRLSNAIDFGKEWFGYPCSEKYFEEIAPIFERLRKLKDKGIEWNQLSDKIETVYLPLLESFKRELSQLDSQHPGEIPKRLLEYLIGRFDFYKIISKDTEKKTVVLSYNLHNTLNKASETKAPDFKTGAAKLPSAIRYFDFYDRAPDTTLELIMNENWAVTFRIHNASTDVEPSLKFDINIKGMPTDLFSHHESWL